MTQPTDNLSPNKQALLKIRELKQQLAAAQEVTGEPIAIVSMACRFPQTSNTPERFWQSLMEQEDLVSDIPDNRWDLEAFHDDDPEVDGKMYARRGVFLDQLDQMDPEFFGISPREATWVDPQQRLLMEVGWEAVERAGWLPEEIGEHTGVFVGWMHNDYQNEASDSFLNLNPYIATGAAGSFLCGRLAYYLGLQGPSVAVDTACSSSLVALHLAIQSLQRRDCDRALVGGVNAICSPTTNILTCKLKALSPSGHSRAFDAAADGYLRGEGCGMVTLRRLSDAQRDNDPILGIIRGSAIGHNGFSSGLTAPNPKSQEKVIRQALDRAGLAPEEVGYLEAHGTGTELGDPIEVNAAAAAYCQSRDESNPLLIGSVKTNIGHLEAAAGMAGLIKVLLAMDHGQIPGQMNFETPNPHIPWDNIPVQVLTQPTDWPNDKRRIAGVSAFGMSGTNAHVIVEAPEPPVEPSTDSITSVTKSDTPSAAHILTLSAKQEGAIFELASDYADTLERCEEISVADVAFTTNTARSHFEHRAAIIAADRTSTIDSLRALARGSQQPGNTFVGNSRRAARVAWQFTGQGSQFVGMGKQLYEQQPVFREALDQCNHWIESIRGQSLLDVMFGHVGDDSDTAERSVDQTHWTQPSIFALQMGLAKLLASWNLHPVAVLGHSVGQYAAACVAGMMDWETGLTLIAERGRLIGELPQAGCMLAVFASPEVVQNAIEQEPCVSLAALNGTHVVISGDTEAIERVDTSLSSEKIRTKKLNTSHAFHSHLMQPALEPFAKLADQFNFKAADIPLVCNVTGQIMAADQTIDGTYWANQIRSAVQYDPGIQALEPLNCDLILELGPQAVLTRMAAASWNQPTNSLISCLGKTTDDERSVAEAIAKMYVLGVTPDFRQLNRNCNPSGQKVELPTYPFQRRRFWGPDKPRAYHAESHTAHPLLGEKISLAGSNHESRFQSHIDIDSPTWMPDHEVMNQVVLPGAAFVEMAVALANESGKTVDDIRFEQPLRLTGRTTLQTVVKNEPNKESAEPTTTNVEVHSSLANADQWSRNFVAKLASSSATSPPPVDLNEIKQQLPESDSPDNFYQKMATLGLNYGPTFQTIVELDYSETEVVTRLKTNGDVRGYHIPPTILDGALHSLAVGLLRSDDGHLFLPVGIGQLELHRGIENEAICHARWNENTGKTRTADLTLLTTEGDIALTIKNLQVQQVDLAAMRKLSGAGAERLIFESHWRPHRLPASEVNDTNWLVVTPAEVDNQLRDELTQALETKGHRFQLRTIDNILSDLESIEWSTFDGITCFVNHAEGDEAHEAIHKIVELIQRMLEDNHRQIRCGLQLITANATTTEVTVGEGSTPTVRPTQSQVWGLGKVLAAEQPELRIRLVDCDRDADLKTTAALISDILLTETEDNQFAIRDNQYFVPRLTRTKPTKATPQELRPGAMLITGGLGMLGRQVAKWLASKGASQLVLVSRREPDDAAMAFIDTMASEHCEVVVHSGDMSCRNDVETLFARFGNDLQPLTGIVHAAGVLDDGLIESQTRDRFEKVLAPKIQAGELLHELTREMDLQLFVLYSSAASVLGSPGQSNYASGNAYLDGLAWQRRQLGLPAVSINWGPWSAGMADDERILKRMALQGITPLDVDEAHAAMEVMLNANMTQATVMDVDWRRMRTGPQGSTPPLLRELVGERRSSGGAVSALVVKLRSLPGNARHELLHKTIQETLQRILSTPEAPETDRPLIEMGLDSLMAVEFGTELQQMLGDDFNVGPTMLFDHPTIDAITDHVLGLVAASDGPETGDEPHVVVRQDSNRSEAAAREDIAVIGMSCRFPGAKNVDQFWDNLLNGVDSVCDIPNDRWDIDQFYSAQREPGKMYTRRGGFLDDIAEFDAAFFNISDQEACWIDPQHRMLLENSYHAMEHAGIPTAPLGDASVGVFMGIMGSDYAFLPKLEDDHIIRGFQGAGLSHSAGVGRISYVFGFEGPSVAIDTASSSSLVAVYQAMRSLQEGNCNMALAGGVNAILVPVNSLLMSKAGLLSPDGRCKSFSKSADGFGRGEGCGVVVLKRLSDAERDGDRILAVIRGGAVVHNGFSGGITSPSGKAQSRVIDAAIKDAGIAPAQVQYLEAHGTGTEYGDPMELGAAMQIYGKGRTQEMPLLIGSVKANISHLEAAGGSSGLIKTVLALYHGIIPQQIHFDEPTPHLPWKRLPVKMVQENLKWPEGQRKTAGITALGLVGTNAHLIISESAEHPAKDTDSTEPSEGAMDNNAVPDHLLPLSARSPAALSQLAIQYIEYLESSDEIRLEDVCRTAGAGRRHFENRLGLVVESKSNAIAQLKRHCQLHSAENNGATSRVERQPNKSQRKLLWTFADRIESSGSILCELRNEFPLIDQWVQQADEKLSAFAQSQSIEFPSIQTLCEQDHSDAPHASTLTYLLQMALARLWNDWGIEPDACFGTGIGQYSSAVMAGCLDEYDALNLVFLRQTFLASTNPDWDQFEQVADGFNFYPPNLPLVCSRSGQSMPIHQSPAGSYWRHHATTSEIVDCRESIANLNCRHTLHFGVGKKPTNDTLNGQATNRSMDPLDPVLQIDLFAETSMDEPFRKTLMTALGRLYVCGWTPNFDNVAGGRQNPVALPGYPFQKRRYWITEISQFMDIEENHKPETSLR
ncbi:MAG: SDR family NAD(P)-dependent oxidoreductase [Planctomycetota bacterium]